MIIALLGLVLLLTLAHYIDLYVICRWRRSRYPITRETRILITGACMGIGRLTALQFARKHRCRIIVIDIRADLSAKLQKEIQDEGAQSAFYHCDLSDSQSLDTTIARILKDHEYIDILINNAGIVNLTSFANASMKQIQRVMQVNYLAPVQIMKILLPLMEQRRSGHIVNLASVASIQTGVNLAEYVASKHALWGFHHSLRQELKMANSPIKTTIICPYAVDTGMVLNNIEEKFKGYSTLLDPIVPILKEDFVGRTVYESVVSGREVVFIRNAYNIILHLVRLLPWTLIDFLMILMQGRYAHKLVGRKAD